MFLTNHTLTGAALAINIENPLILAPAALASHFVLDSIPHFGHPGADWHKWKWQVVAFTDSLLSLSAYLALIAIFPHLLWQITLGVFLATFPDLLYIPRHFWKKYYFKRMQKFHKAIQHESQAGGIVEGLWLLAIIQLINAK